MSKEKNKVTEVAVADLIPDDMNFNKGTEYGNALLEKSFQKFGAGRSILLDKNNRIIAGNKAAGKYGELGGEKVIVVETDGDTLVAVKRTDVDLDSQAGRELALADNATQRADLEWDTEVIEAVSKEWDIDAKEWGVEMPEELNSDIETEQIAPIPEVEELLNRAMQDNCRECVEQIRLLMKEGWLISGYTVGLAKAYFIKALHYKKSYPRWLSYIFHPHQFLTSANKRSMFEQMEITAREGKAGIAGFRTITEDEKPLTTTTKGSYPIGGARLPMDFPAETAEKIIREFGGEGAKVLDPCHGWGGRFVGALLAGASEYVGCDPSAEAHAGLEKMREAYLPYCKEKTRKVEFIQSPYEKCEFKEGAFDLALTSPPYFDVEQYRGEGQSHTEYPQYELWREGFYRPLIANTYRWIKKGGVFVLQVGSQSYPLLADGIEIAKQAGFTVEDIRPLGGGTSSNLHNNTDDDEENEKIIILRK